MTTRTYADPQVIFGLSATPEPASWALMLIGFGGLGAALRSSRQKAAAVS